MYKTGCRILMFTGILLIVLGAYAVLFDNSPWFSPINKLMDPNFWENETLSNGTLNFKIFTWDFLGMLHIIWGVNLFYVVRYGLMKKEAWAWKCILISAITLILVDVDFTLTNHRNTFILITAFFAAIFLIPLMMTREALMAKPV
jgi:hypothetical protein